MAQGCLPLSSYSLALSETHTLSGWWPKRRRSLGKLVKDLSDAERAVTQELNEIGRIRGGGEKTIFEDGFDD